MADKRVYARWVCPFLILHDRNSFSWRLTDDGAMSPVSPAKFCNSLESVGTVIADPSDFSCTNRPNRRTASFGKGKMNSREYPRDGSVNGRTSANWQISKSSYVHRLPMFMIYERSREVTVLHGQFRRERARATAVF